MQELPDLVRDTEQLRRQTLELVREVDEILGIDNVERSAAQDLANTKTQIDSLLSRSQQILDTIGTSLQPIDIDVDDAMITALVLRFDLMNQRGVLADDWRRIKLAADDLRSILNLNASQRIGTDSSTNSPFNFTLDDSQTSVGLTFDAPLNRLAQRNAYRFSLINYHPGLECLPGN